MNLTPYVAMALMATASFNVARADSHGEVRSETVRFADLDINKSPGADILYRRLNIAARNVCRELEPGRSLALVVPHRACVHSALIKALADVGNPAVLAYAAMQGTAATDVTLRVAQSK
jgi:UrcA family protein